MPILRLPLVPVLLALVLAGACDSSSIGLNPFVADACPSGEQCIREPVAVHGGLTFASISVGGEHTCALTSAGQAYCWGSNRRGQLGAGSDDQSSAVPIPVHTDLRFDQLSSGTFHTCALDESGAAHCWGDGSNGALGSSLLADACDVVVCSRVPVGVIGGGRFTKIESGLNHSCALTAGGEAYCWGANEYGELGSGFFFGGSAIPERVAGDHSYAAISAGDGFTCATTGIGAAWCWGSGQHDVLGSVPNDVCPGSEFGARCSPVPQEVRAEFGFAQVSSGSDHACGVRTAGEVYCWGLNMHGQVGVPSVVRTVEPALVEGVALASVVAAGGYTCGVTTDAKAFCWGENRSGQLGAGLPDHGSPIPVPVKGPHAFRSISGGSRHACGLTQSGAAYCWGARTTGQLGDGR